MGGHGQLLLGWSLLFLWASLKLLVTPNALRLAGPAPSPRPLSLLAVREEGAERVEAGQGGGGSRWWRRRGGA